MSGRGWFAEKMAKLRKYQIAEMKEKDAISIISVKMYGDTRYINVPALEGYYQTAERATKAISTYDDMWKRILS